MTQELIGIEAPEFKMPEQICAAVNGGGAGDGSTGGDDEAPKLMQGRTKWYNVAKGWGFITPHDSSIPDVFVHHSVIFKSGFRSLGDDEEVEFVVQKSAKGWEAVKVTAVGGAECQGSTRRPPARRRYKKLRCYNCSEESNHIAAKCPLPPQPKRCHHCKSEGHLIAECPERPGPSRTRPTRVSAEPNGTQSPQTTAPSAEGSPSETNE